MSGHGIWCRVLPTEALRLIRLDGEVAQLAVAHQALHELGAGAEARLGLATDAMGMPWEKHHKKLGIMEFRRFFGGFFAG